jgi:hypothetical protein
MFGGVPRLLICRQTVGIVGSRLAWETVRSSVRMFGGFPRLLIYRQTVEEGRVEEQYSELAIALKWREINEGLNS